jgi:hypothetical protein
MEQTLSRPARERKLAVMSQRLPEGLIAQTGHLKRAAIRNASLKLPGSGLRHETPLVIFVLNAVLFGQDFFG